MIFDPYTRRRKKTSGFYGDLDDDVYGDLDDDEYTDIDSDEYNDIDDDYGDSLEV